MRQCAKLWRVTADLASIRALMRIGAVDSAWQAFGAAGFAERADDARLLCLKGRMLKDRAMAATATDRQALLRAAADAYGAAALLERDTYSRINAATLVHLRGDHAAAAALANEVLAMLDSGDHTAETPYWTAATRAEALLLTGRLAEARQALADAVRGTPAAREDRAATLRQFRRLLAHDDADAGWLDALALPPVLYFRGAMRVASAADEAAIANAVQSIAPGLAFGALAAGTDIIAAEAAVACGAELHVILPCGLEAFRAHSVAPCGEQWLPRFDRLIEQASSVECLSEPGGLTHAAMVMGEWMALGGAVQQARLCDSEPVVIDARFPDRAPADHWLFPHRLHHVTLSAPGPMAARNLAPPDEPSLWIARPGEGSVLPLSLSAAPDVLPNLPLGSVLDVDALGDARQEPPRFAALRRLSSDHALIASREAALILEPLCSGLRAVLAGEVTGTSGAVNVYDVIIEAENSAI